MAVQDIYKNLTDEQKEKFKACKTQEDLMKALDEENIELSPDQLEAVAGGGSWCDDCPNNSCDVLCPEDCTRYMYCLANK